MQTGAILSIMVAMAAGYIGNILYRHEQRDLKVGSSAATPEMMAHESWEAVVDSEYTIYCGIHTWHTHICILLL